MFLTVKVRAAANTSIWKDSDSGADGPEGSWNSPECPWGPGTSCSWILVASLAYYLHTLYLHYCLAVPCLFLQIVVFPAHCNSSTLCIWCCPCSWKLLAGRQCRCLQWLEASSSQMFSCFLKNYFQRNCHSLSPCLLLQHHFVTAGLALGQRGKLAMGRGEEGEEGQVSILRAGLCLEAVVEVYWGNSSVLTTLLKNLESSVESFDQVYSGEVSRVENHWIWGRIHGKKYFSCITRQHEPALSTICSLSHLTNSQPLPAPWRSLSSWILISCEKK